jgi:methyl-accepting chemotaxis protein
MKLRTRLMLAPAVTGAMLVITLGASVVVLNRYKATSESSHEQLLGATTRVAAVQAELSSSQIHLYRTVTIASSLDDAAVKSERAALAAKIKSLVADSEGAASSSTDDVIKRKLATFVDDLKKYGKSADSAIDLATVDANTGVAALQTSDADYVAMNKVLAEVVDEVSHRGTEVHAQLEAAASLASWTLAALGALAACGAIAFSWATQRRIVASINTAVRASAEVARGGLDVRPHSDDADEVGELLRALGAMVGQLSDSLQTVRHAAASIGTASSEIASGNQDLSSRTEQTASNLQQTASSMEQITGTVKQSADSARSANELASSAAEVAARGGAVVAEVVATMSEINASSKKISEIISVIDGIAFQTNILALNAAVEAARAGEQGKGFAVVASEVRSLAHRSAEAAREIKSLIGASVEKVEGGSRLVASAGQTMGEIVSSVKRVSDIIGAITDSAAEQSEGIGQISVSVNQLDKMTQQNAALVEESAAAAESLKAQANRLADVVGSFRLLPGA